MAWPSPAFRLWPDPLLPSSCLPPCPYRLVVVVVVVQLPLCNHAIVTAQLRSKLEPAGLPFAGALPEDPILSSVR